MKSEKSPAFQFYPNDFVGSGRVGMMTPEEVGVYVLLLCLDWNDTGFAYDATQLARWCRTTPAKFAAAWRTVQACFVERDGRWFNPRLDAERAKQRAWREKSSRGGKRGAESRWHPDKGGDEGGHKGGYSTVTECLSPNDDTPFPTPTPVTTKARSKSKAPAALSPDEQRVLDHYATRHPRRKITAKATQIVRKALGFGYTPDDLCAAIDGNADDAWHRDKQKHELSYVLRDAEHIDGFRINAEPQQPIIDEFGVLTAYGERVTRPARYV